MIVCFTTLLKLGRLDYFLTSVYSGCSLIFLIIYKCFMELSNFCYSFVQSLLLKVNKFIQVSSIHHQKLVQKITNLNTHCTRQFLHFRSALGERGWGEKEAYLKHLGNDLSVICLKTFEVLSVKCSFQKTSLGNYSYII